MATRSRIGIEYLDGTIGSIYCHNDGYPSWVGKFLVEHWQDREKVEALIALGNISSLGRGLEGETFDKRTKHDGTFTIAYHRDRGEELEFFGDTNRDEYVSTTSDSGGEYAYLFDLNGMWMVLPMEPGKGWRPVHEEIGVELQPSGEPPKEVSRRRRPSTCSSRARPSSDGRPPELAASP